MCNNYRLKVDVASIVEDFADLKIKIRFGEGTPNIEARDDIKITDVAPVIRTFDRDVTPNLHPVVIRVGSSLLRVSAGEARGCSA